MMMSIHCQENVHDRNFFYILLMYGIQYFLFIMTGPFNGDKGTKYIFLYFLRKLPLWLNKK
jgi:hypothetical protein